MHVANTDSLDGPYWDFVLVLQCRSRWLQHILSKLTIIYKQHVPKSRDVISTKKHLWDASYNRQGLGSTIWWKSIGHLPLFAANLSTSCRYMPLSLPLFAAICCLLPLFTAMLSLCCHYVAASLSLFYRYLPPCSRYLSLFAAICYQHRLSDRAV